MQESSTDNSSQGGLQRRLGLFDATMLVMGGIIGSGIFMNPSVVARVVHTPAMILGAWIAGGLVAMAGGFIYAELASRSPNVGGQYAYLREAYHPVISFLNGWALLLVIQTGGMAAVAVTFARYFNELTNSGIADPVVASVTLALLTAVNCLGVRSGSTVQNILMLMKILAIMLLIIAGAAAVRSAFLSPVPVFDQPVSMGLLASIGASMVPVLFAYGGWQTSCFVAGEVRNPRRNLPLGLAIGVAGVVLLYLAVNIICLGVLGAGGLAATHAPASEVMRRVFGNAGGMVIAVGIAVSTLGFLSQGILTAPRVYFAMARDGVFFKKVGEVHPVTHVPVTAIVMQGILAIVITFSGRYEQILNYVVSSDFIFFGLSATCLFVFRRREAASGIVPQYYRMPLQRTIPILFIAVCWLVVVATIVSYPSNSLIGIAIVCSGIPVFAFWRKRTSV